MKRKLFVIIALLMSLVVCIPAYAGTICDDYDDVVARPATGTCLYSEKSKTSDVICFLYDDYNYNVTYADDDWVRISVCSGVAGYVCKDDVILLEGAGTSSDITYGLSAVTAAIAKTTKELKESVREEAEIAIEIARLEEEEQAEIIETIAGYIDKVSDYYDITTTVADEVSIINNSYEQAVSGDIADARAALSEAKAALKDAKTKAKDVEALRNSIVSYAVSYVGVLPYVYGGTSLVYGADCSGFTQAIYKHFGYAISRTSYSQRSDGVSVSYSDLKPGDIVCFSGHVGIYIGNDQFVHSPSTGKRVKINTLSTFSKKVIMIRRIVV